MIMTTILAILIAFIVATTAALPPLTTTISTFISAVIQQQNFIAELKSEMVVPSISSNATGTAYFQLDMEDNNKIEYSIIATNLHSVKAAHIHIGKEGKNGPSIVTLYKPFTGKGELGRILSVRDDITADILEGPLAGKQISNILEFMNNRTAYVDIHSQEHPDGELRGQISNRTSISS
jgi:hypothetical protein